MTSQEKPHVKSIKTTKESGSHSLLCPQKATTKTMCFSILSILPHVQAPGHTSKTKRQSVLRIYPIKLHATLVYTINSFLALEQMNRSNLFVNPHL